MIWDDVVINELKSLWINGHSTAEIGRRLGVSKNAIVGKAHRLDLHARPSPIRCQEGTEPRPRPPRPLPAPMPLPPLASLREPAPPPPPEPIAKRAIPIVPAAIANYRGPVQPPPAPIPVIYRPRSTAICCWPIGMPGTRDFRFCEGSSLPGKPYCADHAKLAYVKIRES